MTHEPKAITGARRRVLREAGGPTRCAPPALAALLLAWTLGPAGPAAAAGERAKPAPAAGKAPAKAVRPDTARAGARPRAPASAAPAARPMAAGVALPQADDDQRAAAAMAHLGEYACEFGEQVRVQPSTRHDGYLDVIHRRSSWTMKPVLSSTGALRLEDVGGRTMMLQIAAKSMLMDTRAGRRLVDDCVHEQQRHAAPPSPAESLGIQPPGSSTTPS